MPAEMIDGKRLSEKILEEVGEAVGKMGEKPCLGVILVGDDPASKTYVSRKEEACKKTGVSSVMKRLGEDVTEDGLLSQIREFAKDDKVHAILVQLPLPGHINEKKVIDSIPPEKDADGFAPSNVGNMLIGDYKILPATAKGIVRMLDELGVPLEGAEAVVVGASNIAGKPAAVLLQQRGCTVTICDIHTKNLAKNTKKADVLVCAVGKAGLITKDMVKEGAVVIDVGITKDNKKLLGDVSPDVSEVAGYLTPVPGGVGPMTVAMLLENTVECMRLQQR